MKGFAFALLCAFAIVAAQGRTLRQAENRTSTETPAAPPAGNRTFASAIEAANVTANVSYSIKALDNAYDAGAVANSPKTILVPTNEAYNTALDSAGLTDTRLQALDIKQLTAVQLAIAAYLRYHILPNVTLMNGDITDGLSLPTELEGAGNITVHVNPTTHNITFTGFINAADPAAAANNTANTLFPDIPVKGLDGVVLYVIDKVLSPSLEYQQKLAARYGSGAGSLD